MDDLRQLIAEDLADAVEGEVRADSVAASLYATDASLYEIEPAGVICPASAADVETVVRFCGKHSIPVTARGAGTGVAGGALGKGVILDMTRHMRRILRINADTVTVQPGVTRVDLNRALRPEGRYFAPDPSNSAISTLGGMAAVDAAGSHAVRVGSVRDHLQSLECVVGGGQRLRFGKESMVAANEFAGPVVGITDTDPGLPGRPSGSPPMLPATELTEATRRTEILQGLARVLSRHADLIKSHQPVMLRNTSGYMLRGVHQGGYLDLPRLLAGSEGTLGVFTELTLHTLPLPENIAVSVLLFGGLEAALAAMQTLLPLEPSACDLMDRRLISLGRVSDPRFQDILLPTAEVALFVEFVGASARETQDRALQAEDMLRSRGIHFRRTRTAVTFEEAEFLWSIPTSVVSMLAGLKGESRPVPFIEDIAVPPEAVSEFLNTAQRIFQRYELTATLYAHAASGQLHLRPILPIARQRDGEYLEALARDLYRHVTRLGGTISGEHGDGLSRTAFLRTQYGPLYKTFRSVKQIFDPEQILNPDKIISNDGKLTRRYLRRSEPVVVPESEASTSSETLLPVLQLNWSMEEAAAAAVRCNGCGVCRTESDALRMCPFFHKTHAEADAPRAKANLIRTALTTANGIADLAASPDAQELSQSCFNCKQCTIECPSHVDIPHLLLELRAQQVSQQGLSASDWLLSRIHGYANIVRRFSFTANLLLRSRLFRRLLRRLTGIAEQRRLPAFVGRPFLRSSRVRKAASRRSIVSPERTVVLFCDYFANYHDPQLAESCVRILEHHGYDVIIPRHQTVSGMAMISVGDLEAAREMAQRNVEELLEPAREGCRILCPEPTTAICLREEYPRILRHPDVRLVADHVRDVGGFLSELLDAGQLRGDLTPLPMSFAMHVPCHTRALAESPPYERLLKQIPELKLTTMDSGCSGMAGTYGLAEQNFAESLRIGERLISSLNSADVVAGVTECSSCRMQMEQKAAVPTVHPLKLLALSWGLMPDIAGTLRTAPAGLRMS